jgi:hypothetical protein
MGLESHSEVELGWSSSKDRGTGGSGQAWGWRLRPCKREGQGCGREDPGEGLEQPKMFCSLGKKS